MVKLTVNQILKDVPDIKHLNQYLKVKDLSQTAFTDVF